MQDATQGSSERAFDFDFDPVAERFFSQPPAPHELAHELDDWQPEPLSSLERVAMLTTAAPAMAILAVAITLLLSHPLITPAPSRAPLEPAPHVLEATAAETRTAPRPEAPLRPELAIPAAPAVHAVAQPRVAPAQPVRAARASSSARRVKTASGAKRARQLLDAGDAAAARDVARDAVRSAPSRAAGYIVLAAALDALGDRAGKAATFRSCAQLATDPLASACKTLARTR